MAEALLTVEHLTKSVGEKMLFEDISFGILEGQKSALIARNGYGKSTLLNILTGKTLQDDGTITYRTGVRVAYLEQNLTLNSRLTLRQYIYSLPCPEHLQTWEYEQRIEEVVGKMGLTKMLDRDLSTFSGGEQKKAALCRMLLEDSQLLILDEPTNHLDIDMIEWLEDFLARQKLAILLVSHDRYFLDNVCNDIYELDNASLYHYRGNYDYYIEKKAEREFNERAEVEKAKSLYRTELEWTRRMPKARGTKSRARIDAFYELEQKAHTHFDAPQHHFTVRTERLGGKILELYNVSYQNLVSDFSYTFKRGERVGIVGANGVGKSTFLNLLTEGLRPTSGHVVVGQTIQFGYYTQQGMQAKVDQRVIDIVKDVAEQIDLDGGKSMSAHQFLTYFGFDSTTQYNYFGNLSGGERRRLYLLMVLIANPNFLILDEPTNDLDIYTLQILEQFLLSYRGCLVIVSHDRSFLDHIVDHLFVFQGEGKIKDFYGNYSDYRLQEAAQRRQNQLESRSAKPVREKTAPAKVKATFKQKQEYEQLGSEIEVLTNERRQLEEEISSGLINDHERLLEVSARIGEIIALLDDKELRWLELDELM